VKVKNKFTRKQVIKALEATGGFITHAADKLGCCYQTIESYIKKDPSIAEAIKHIQENRLDIAENVVMVAMKDKGEMKEALNAAKYYLKYKGRGRGYIKHQKIEVSEDLSKMMRDAEERTMD
jgi:hypothetical protein